LDYHDELNKLCKITIVDFWERCADKGIKVSLCTVKRIFRRKK
jgi:hypothetical protein